MSDRENGDERRRILKLPGAQIDDNITVVDRHELTLEELRAELRRECFVLHRGLQDANGAIQIHQAALLELVPIVNDLERATWAGRIRRVRVWFFRAPYLQSLRQYLVALGIIRPIVPTTRPDLDNPEAMPKR
jgi:hypothetical protein